MMLLMMSPRRKYPPPSSRPPFGQLCHRTPLGVIGRDLLCLPWAEEKLGNLLTYQRRVRLPSSTTRCDFSPHVEPRVSYILTLLPNWIQFFVYVP